MKQLERDPDAKLRGEWNSDRRAGAEEISQGSLRYLELLQAGDGRRLRAGCIRANTADDGPTVLIGHRLGPGHRQLNDVDRVIRAGVIAVEDVEELGEGVNLPALADLNGTRDAQVRLNVGRTAEYVQTCIRRLRRAVE